MPRAVTVNAALLPMIATCGPGWRMITGAADTSMEPSVTAAVAERALPAELLTTTW